MARAKRDKIKEKIWDQRSYAKKKANPEWVEYNRAKTLKWQRDNPERYKQRQMEWNSNPLTIATRVRIRARKRNIEFALTLEDIVVPECCPILGIKLNLEEHDHYPTVDRIDNSRGYFKDNICVISFRANRIKSDATLEELEAIVRYMKEHLN